MGYSQLVLKMEVIDHDLQGNFGRFDSEFYEIRFVCAITCYRFGLEAPKSHQTCNLGYSRLILKTGVIDIDFQGHSGHFVSEFYEIRLFRANTCDGFQMESPNLHQIYILGFSQLVLKMCVVYLDLQDHLVISTQNFKKRRSTSLLYTDLGRPRVFVTRPERALVSAMKFCWICWIWNICIDWTDSRLL